MNKYLDLLEKIKMESKGHLFTGEDVLLEKIGLYMQGKITSQELISGIDVPTIEYIRRILNKILNYKEKDVRYFVRIPDKFPFCMVDYYKYKCIYAAKLLKYCDTFTLMEIIGPRSELFELNSLVFSDTSSFVEVDGDFSKFPDGFALLSCEWLGIISRYPNLYKELYRIANVAKNKNDTYITHEQVKSQFEEEIAKYYNHSFYSKKSFGEFIDGIKFVMRKEYLTREEALTGNFGTFEQLIERTKVTEDSEDLKNNEFLEEEKNSKVEFNNNVVKVGITDLIEFLESSKYKNIAMAVDSGIPYLAEKNIYNCSPKELVIMLTYFALNYHGNSIQRYLAYFGNDNAIINGRIYDVPVIEFAKLNSPEMVANLSSLGAKDIKTKQSENKEAVISIAKMLGYNQERNISTSDALDVLNDILEGSTTEKLKRTR